MKTKTRNKSRAEVLADGILPCGHTAEREDDKIIIDQCFQCEWSTPTRKEANRLNNLMSSRGDEESRLVQMAREGSHSSNETLSGLHSAEIKERMDHIHELTEAIERQRVRVRITQEEEDVRGS